MITHLACIMDGNRRWAKKRGLNPWIGHQEGVNAVERTIDFCLKNNIPYLSLYAFSIENLGRPEIEKSFLFNTLFPQVFKKIVSQMAEKKVRIRFIGDRSLFPASIRDKCKKLEEDTKQYDNLIVNLLFCYGGRQEITAAVKSIAHDVQNGTLQLPDITDDYVYKQLWLGDTPEPELIIRTGGAQRLSNFLLYQAAYSELYFLDCFWPDLTETDLKNALDYYASCKRSLGV